MGDGLAARPAPCQRGDEAAEDKAGKGRQNGDHHQKMRR
jgi:hypothetical protein